VSKKPNTAAALAGILNARRGEETSSEPAASAEAPVTPEPPVNPSPPLPETPSPVHAAAPVTGQKARIGKSKDKATYSQFSVYLRKDTRKKAGRVLEDTNPDQDFSELVQELLEQWLASRT
jgi:hypothetical protein